MPFAQPLSTCDLLTLAEIPVNATWRYLMREVADDLADGAISDNELAKVEAADLRTALAVLLSDLRRLNKEGQRQATG